jgi:hypothetical protein
MQKFSKAIPPPANFLIALVGITLKGGKSSKDNQKFFVGG